MQLRIAVELLAWVDGQVEDAERRGERDELTGHAVNRTTVFRRGVEVLRDGASRPDPFDDPRARADHFRRATQ